MKRRMLDNPSHNRAQKSLFIRCSKMKAVVYIGSAIAWGPESAMQTRASFIFLRHSPMGLTPNQTKES